MQQNRGGLPGKARALAGSLRCRSKRNSPVTSSNQQRIRPATRILRPGAGTADRQLLAKRRCRQLGTRVVPCHDGVEGLRESHSCGMQNRLFYSGVELRYALRSDAKDTRLVPAARPPVRRRCSRTGEVQATTPKGRVPFGLDLNDMRLWTLATCVTLEHANFSTGGSASRLIGHSARKRGFHDLSGRVEPLLFCASNR